MMTPEFQSIWRADRVGQGAIMRIAFVSLILLAGACQPGASEPQAASAPTPPESPASAPAQTQTPAPAPAAAVAPPKVFLEPVLDAKGVTAEQAALDSACNRRSQLPRAIPMPSEQAMAATGRAVIRDGKLIVGKHSFEPRDRTNDEGEGYSYAGKYAAADVDIILAEVDLGVGWRVLHPDAGLLELPHLLIPSPDGGTWVTSTDWEGDFGTVTFYRIDPKQWTKLAELHVDHACSLRWADDTTVEFRAGEKPGPLQRITLEAGQWVLQTAD